MHRPRSSFPRGASRCCSRRRRTWRIAPWIAITLLIAAGTGGARELAAQPRTLDWPRIDVTAHLDADGRLRVVERQAIRFNGDWNGGERRFRLGRQQRLSVVAIDRIGPGDDSVRLTEGDLDRVDHWGRSDVGTVRWRSRLPSDPLFRDDTLTYRLEVVYDRILVTTDDGWLLDHDFGFGDRNGTIGTFTLTLTLDEAWRPVGDFSERREARDLRPGAGFPVRLALTRAADAPPPASVWAGATRPLRLALLAVLLAGIGGIAGRVLRRDVRLGRFATALRAEAITPAVLERDVFAHRPEVIGAAWDGATGSAEVAAVLARLVTEGALTSRVEETKRWWFRRTVLHLTLEVSRETLRPYERSLIDGLFEPGETVTSTDAVRERYRRSGFDPARRIRSALEREVEALAPAPEEPKPSRWPAALLLLAAIGAFVRAGVENAFDLQPVLIVAFASIPWYGLSWTIAAQWRERVTGYAVVAVPLLLLLLGPVAAAGWWLYVRGAYAVGPWALAGIACWLLAAVWSIGNSARCRLSPERVALRRRLVAIRDHFARELKRREPALEDAWYPWLLALGLGPRVDRWFRAFGGVAAASASAATGRSIASSSAGVASGASSSDSFGGFGGGGGFSGGGGGTSFGGASFGAALAGMAASVPSPASSSSGSSGGGGGSSSSGGGGGGGW